jgi:DNA polymerase III subunit delta
VVAVKAGQANSYLKSLDAKVRAILFFGPDAGLVSERSARLAQHWAALDKPPGEILRFDDEVLADDPDRLMVELGTLPMFGGRKVIRAIAGRRIDGKSLAAVVDQGGADAFLVVEAGNLLPSSELRQLFEKATSAAAIACYADDQAAVGLVIDEVLRAHRMTIDPAARAALVHRLGADRALTRNEIEKLALYAHGRDKITEDDVDMIVGDAADLALDAIVNLAASGKVTEALADTARAWAAGESAQVLIGAIQRHLLRLHKARVAMDNGASLDTILRQQRPPLNFKMQPIFSGQCRAWSIAALTTALRLTSEAALAARLKSDLEEALAERLVLNVGYLARGGVRASAGALDRR